MSRHVDLDDLEDEETELLTCISQGIAAGSSPSFVETLLNAGPAGHAIRQQLNRTVPGFNCTLLMILTNRPDEDQAIATAEMLVRYGANVNQSDDTDLQSSPLCMAADFGRAKYLEWLVDHGARINHHPAVTPTMPIGLSSEKNFPKCVAILAKAAIAPPVCRERLATLDAPSIYGKTPAYVAMEKGHAECLGALAMAGADLRRCFPVYFDFETHLVDIGNDLQPHTSMQKAVVSFTTSHCANCRKFARVLNSCSRCRLAQYCSRDCQTEDWKLHKKCCKRLRAGEDLVSETGKPPDPRSEPFGFQLPNPSGANVGEDEDDDEDDVVDGNEAVWQYNAGSRGIPDWKCYPAKISRYIEGMFQMGGPRYMYRPGDDEAEGVHLPAGHGLSTAPPGVATNYVYYHDMLEREVFTGAIRAVRRNKKRTAPEVENPIFY